MVLPDPLAPALIREQLSTGVVGAEDAVTSPTLRSHGGQNAQHAALTHVMRPVRRSTGPERGTRRGTRANMASGSGIHIGNEECLGSGSNGLGGKWCGH